MHRHWWRQALCTSQAKWFLSPAGLQTPWQLFRLCQDCKCWPIEWPRVHYHLKIIWILLLSLSSKQTVQLFALPKLQKLIDNLKIVGSTKTQFAAILVFVVTLEIVRMSSQKLNTILFFVFSNLIKFYQTSLLTNTRSSPK